MTDEVVRRVDERWDESRNPARPRCRRHVAGARPRAPRLAAAARFVTFGQAQLCEVGRDFVRSVPTLTPVRLRTQNAGGNSFGGG